MQNQFSSMIGRRAFLKGSTLFLAGGMLGAQWDVSLEASENAAEVLRIGMITDLHYADKPVAGSRHYRETPQKLAEADERFQQADVNFVVELGDFIDAAPDVKTELNYLKTINSQFSKIHSDRHYVLGNHCVETLTKEEFLGEVGQEKSWYSFDRNGFHFVVLDSCFSSHGKPYGRKSSNWTDANFSAEELEWLKGDLTLAKKPTIVFAHQRLDVGNHYGVKNAGDARKIFENSEVVQAVFQGHSHKNDYNEINGIHYCTLVAMIEGAAPENNGYSVLSLSDNGIIKLTGFRKQNDRSWKRAILH